VAQEQVECVYKNDCRAAEIDRDAALLPNPARLTLGQLGNLVITIERANQAGPGGGRVVLNCWRVIEKAPGIAAIREYLASFGEDINVAGVNLLRSQLARLLNTTVTEAGGLTLLQALAVLSGPPRLVLDREKGEVKVDGTVYPIKNRRAFTAFVKIVDGNGAVIEGSALGRGRVDRVFKEETGFPQAVRATFESQKGHGGGYYLLEPYRRPIVPLNGPK
jgi:hypothetical protein